MQINNEEDKVNDFMYKILIEGKIGVFKRNLLALGLSDSHLKHILKKKYIDNKYLIPKKYGREVIYLFNKRKYTYTSLVQEVKDVIKHEADEQKLPVPKMTGKLSNILGNEKNFVYWLIMQAKKDKSWTFTKNSLFKQQKEGLDKPVTYGTITRLIGENKDYFIKVNVRERVSLNPTTPLKDNYGINPQLTKRKKYQVRYKFDWEKFIQHPERLSKELQKGLQILKTENDEFGKVNSMFNHQQQ